MNLLAALALEPILPGPQILMALGNYVGEAPPTTSDQRIGIGTVVFLAVAIGGFVWWSSRQPLRRNPRRLRRNPTEYTRAWEALIDAERRGESPTRIHQLRMDLELARDKVRARWRDDDTEGQIKELVRRKRS